MSTVRIPAVKFCKQFVYNYMVNECCCVISKPRRFSNDRQDVIGIKHILKIFSLSMFIEFQEIYIHISKDVNFVSIGINCFDYIF